MFDWPDCSVLPTMLFHCLYRLPLTVIDTQLKLWLPLISSVFTFYWFKTCGILGYRKSYNQGLKKDYMFYFQSLEVYHERRELWGTQDSVISEVTSFTTVLDFICKQSFFLVGGKKIMANSQVSLFPTELRPACLSWSLICWLLGSQARPIALRLEWLSESPEGFIN